MDSTQLKNVVDRFIENRGDTITIYSVTMSYNSRGDQTASYGSGTSSKGLVYRLNKDSRFEQEGVVLSGTPRMLVKSGVTVRPKYKITHRSQNYQVTGVRSLVQMQDETNTPKIVELTRL